MFVETDNITDNVKSVLKNNLTERHKQNKKKKKKKKKKKETKKRKKNSLYFFKVSRKKVLLGNSHSVNKPKITTTKLF